MKASREHAVPLSLRCIEILERARQIGPHGPDNYVFAGRGIHRPLSNMVFLMALRRLKRSNITAHGFRSSFTDWVNERTNTPWEVSEAALAHVLPSRTQAAYSRTDFLEKRRTMMDSWAQFATSTPAKVVALNA